MELALFLLGLVAIIVAVKLLRHHKPEMQQKNRYSNFQVPVDDEPAVEITRIFSPLDVAVEEVYERFSGMDRYFERMTEDTFSSYCHSQLSGGIGMQIRNHFRFWEMLNGSIAASELYTYLLHNDAVHPDGMSDAIIRGVYRKYHLTNPGAKQEVQKFLQYQEKQRATQYKSNALPFDIRYPHEIKLDTPITQLY